MDSEKQLKNDLHNKLNKYTNTLQACSTLRHSLNTSKLYLKENSKSVDSTILGLIYKQIVNHTSSVLPNSCNITKSFDFSKYDSSKTKAGNETIDFVYFSYYIFKDLFIDESSKSKPLMINTSESRIDELDSKLHKLFLKYNSAKMKVLKKNEKQSLKGFSAIFVISTIFMSVGFLSWVISCLNSAPALLDYVLITIAGAGLLSAFMNIGISDDYKEDHNLYKSTFTKRKAYKNDLLNIINILLKNVKSTVAQIKSEKSKANKDFGIKLYNLKVSHQANLPTTTHLKQIENNGKDWSALSKKATKLEEQHAYI